MEGKGEPAIFATGQVAPSLFALPGDELGPLRLRGWPEMGLWPFVHLCGQGFIRREVEPVDSGKVFRRVRTLDRSEGTNVPSGQVSGCIRNGRIPIRASRRMSCTVDSGGIRQSTSHTPARVNSRGRISEPNASLGTIVGSDRVRQTGSDNDSSEASGFRETNRSRVYKWSSRQSGTLESSSMGSNPTQRGRSASARRVGDQCSRLMDQPISPAIDRLRLAGGVVGVGRPQYRSSYLGHDLAFSFESANRPNADRITSDDSSSLEVTVRPKFQTVALGKLNRSPLVGKVEDSYSAHFHRRRLDTNPDGAPLTKGLRMSFKNRISFGPEINPGMSKRESEELNHEKGTFESGFDHNINYHNPVMVAEVVNIFSSLKTATVVDCTLGGGGHSRALMESNPEIDIIGIDKDVEAIEYSNAYLSDFRDRVTFVNTGFENLSSLSRVDVKKPIKGLLFDLGVSSHQLDTAERGFSIRFDSKIDMRMDRNQSLGAYQVVNEYDIDQLRTIIAHNGEARFASRIASAIMSHRPIQTTSSLAQIISEAIPKKYHRPGRHPATRVFQAIRAEVNNELVNLDIALTSALELLDSGGIIVAISYQSGEDRLVKGHFEKIAKGDCQCPSHLPCVCGSRPIGRKIVKKIIRPTNEEKSLNPRSSAAKLRAVEILTAISSR